MRRRSSSPGRRGFFIRAALSAIAGNVTLAASDRVERRLLGRRPVYAPVEIAARLLGTSPRRPAARLVATLLRWTYGAALGAAHVALRPRLRRTHAVAGLLTGLGIFAFECVALPRTGATPSLARWPQREVLLLALHASTWGLGAALGVGAWASGARPSRHR